jgi:aminoglycoside 6'-N-acetyltransferase I
MLIEKISKYNIKGLAELFTESSTDCNFEKAIERCQELLESEEDMCFIGKDRGDYIAFIHIENLFQSPLCYIKNIYVHPNFRQIGIGNHLISLSKSWCKERNCSQIALNTEREIQNQKSITFLKNRGFQKSTDVMNTLIKEIKI